MLRTSSIDPVESAKCGGRPADRAIVERSSRVADLPPGAEGIQFSGGERPESPSGQPPGGFRGDESQVGHDCQGEHPVREVRPEQDLRIAGDPALEFGAAMIVGGGDVVEDPARRGRTCSDSRPTAVGRRGRCPRNRSEQGSNRPRGRSASAR